MKAKGTIMRIPPWTAALRALLGSVFLFLALVAPAGAQPSSGAMARADSLYVARAWEAAASAYEALVQSHPDDARLWSRYGMSLLQLDRAAEAVTAFEQAEAIGHHPMVMYNLACALSRTGESDRALDWLQKAAEAGFARVDQLDADPDLEPLRQKRRWSEVRRAVDRQARPCVHDPAYRGLDFWIGHWDVKTPQGQAAGESHVEIILGTCVVFEHWSGFRGMNGKSFNFIDPQSRQWKQTWVDDKGDVHEYVGEVVDGAMRFRRETQDADGTTTLHRMTLTPLETGHVRQLGESSQDGGRTWSVQYDLHYFRREPPPAAPVEP